MVHTPIYLGCLEPACTSKHTNWETWVASVRKGTEYASIGLISIQEEITY